MAKTARYSPMALSGSESESDMDEDDNIIMQADRLNDSKYLHWVRTSLSLLYLKKGLAKFSDEKAGELHHAVSKQVRLKNQPAATAKCTKCTHKSAVKTKTHDKKHTTWTMNCYANVCNAWLEDILPYHQHLPLPNIAWANSNPHLWPSHAWEVAKLYQPYGCEKHTQAEDSDCTALLTMMLNCSFFHTFLPNTAVLQEIKDVRNACMHSGDLQIDGAEMKRGLGLMVSLLDEPELKNRNECVEAKMKILQLRDNILDLSLNKELELKALNHRITEVRNDMDSLAAEHQQLQSDMNEITNRQDSTVEEYKQLRERRVTIGQQISEMAKNLETLKQTNDPSLGVKVDNLASRLQELETKSQEDIQHVRDKIHSTMAIFEARLHDLETEKAEGEERRKEVNVSK